MLGFWARSVLIIWSEVQGGEGALWEGVPRFHCGTSFVKLAPSNNWISRIIHISSCWFTIYQAALPSCHLLTLIFIVTYFNFTLFTPGVGGGGHIFAPPMSHICVYLCKYTYERFEKTCLFPKMSLEKGSMLFTQGGREIEIEIWDICRNTMDPTFYYFWPPPPFFLSFLQWIQWILPESSEYQVVFNIHHPLVCKFTHIINNEYCGPPTG